MPTRSDIRILTLAVLLLSPFLVISAACGGAETSEPIDDAGAGTAIAADAGDRPDGAAADSDDTPAPGATEQPGAADPPEPSDAVIASQETNWPAVVAEVTELRRRGNTLTTRVRFTNRGEERIEPDVHYDEVYLMDAAAGKKYEVLRDEENRFIAALRSGWNNRWYQTLEPGQAYTVWMKFPAPPPEVRAVTLQIPGMPPFEELPIQGS